jgi:methionine biosynthesis protein MetW
MKKGQFYAKGYYAGLAPEPRFKEILQICNRLKGERLLDIGCGDGAFTVLLKEALNAKEAVGVEVAPEAIDTANARGINAIQLDIDEAPLPFGDAYFDVIYCGEVIEHLFNPDHLLEEIHRVLKPEGTCVITTPNLAGWPNRLALLLGYQPYPTAVSPKHEGVGKLLIRGSEGQWGHIRVFTARALKELLRLHHFKIKALVGCPVLVSTSQSRVLTSLTGLVDKMMSQIPSLSTRIIAVLEKE